MLFGAQSSLKTFQAHAHARALATVDLAVIMSITKRCWLMARTCTLEHAVRDRGREWRTLKIDAHDRGLAIDTQKRYRAMVHSQYTSELRDKLHRNVSVFLGFCFSSGLVDSVSVHHAHACVFVCISTYVFREPFFRCLTTIAVDRSA